MNYLGTIFAFRISTTNGILKIIQHFLSLTITKINSRREKQLELGTDSFIFCLKYFVKER